MYGGGGIHIDFDYFLGGLKAETTYWYRVYSYRRYYTVEQGNKFLEEKSDYCEKVSGKTSPEKGIIEEESNWQVIIPTGTFKDPSYIDISPIIDPWLEIEIGRANQRLAEYYNYTGIQDTMMEINVYDLWGNKFTENDFKKEVEIKVFYDDVKIEEQNIDENTLKIFRFNESMSEWDKIEEGKQTINKIDNYVSAKVSHFSIYCLMGGTGEFSITCLTNYPNPFSSETKFVFGITKDADIKISIYTIAGRLIKRFEENNMSVGHCEIPISGNWDGADDSNPPKQLANGVYLYKITATPTDGGNSVSKTGKLVIMR